MTDAGGVEIRGCCGEGRVSVAGHGRDFGRLVITRAATWDTQAAGPPGGGGLTPQGGGVTARALAQGMQLPAR